jgi:hypothetical protein
MRKIYQVKKDGEIWFAYGPGSGSTTKIKGGYITDKKDDTKYNQTTHAFVEYAKANKPMATNKDKSVGMYALPVYDSMDHSMFDVWGGDKKPAKVRYFVVSKGEINVVNFFETKGEASNWIKHTA